MRRAVVYALLAAVCVVVAAVWYNQPTVVPLISATDTHATGFRTVIIGRTSVRATVADTPASREKGLGGRSSLARDEGMLFVFPQDGMYAFWMKDMRFPIDIIWISVSGSIVHIAPNVSPATYPQDFAPAGPARYVLEVPAGFSEAHRLSVGDIVGL